MIKIKRFQKEKGFEGHNGTVLADYILPEGQKAPFFHKYGYLENRHTMLGHAHETDEIYHVVYGKGTCIVGGENIAVQGGDVLDIPANVWHTMSCGDEGPLLWGCYWWPVIPEGRVVPKQISVKRFEPTTAYDAHEGTILADKVCPPGMTAPFWHQYGYLEPGKSMAGHEHETLECYVVTDGAGYVVIGEEEAPITIGDVIEIPPNVWHTMRAAEDSTLTWFALWWNEADNLSAEKW